MVISIVHDQILRLSQLYDKNKSWNRELKNLNTTLIAMLVVSEMIFLIGFGLCFMCLVFVFYNFLSDFKKLILM